ncbi:hypothetical protein DAEQUDRAFT_486468 [Daedalea quercina L-15889]|uniref:Uncharacterized protein n=1 Tax=Daedalea quercina L-15889 TaxID=1314783 RepID=A0A165MQ78_9APHY|nr:hypothetical protein DAEQUDRAFT_486468 [Daedalea quercina L-15889]
MVTVIGEAHTLTWTSYALLATTRRGARHYRGGVATDQQDGARIASGPTEGTHSDLIAADTGPGEYVTGPDEAGSALPDADCGLNTKPGWTRKTPEAATHAVNACKVTADSEGRRSSSSGRARARRRGRRWRSEAAVGAERGWRGRGVARHGAACGFLIREGQFRSGRADEVTARDRISFSFVILAL